MAMANENSARGQPKSAAMGIWKTPKLARRAKLISRISDPPIRMGVNKRDVVMAEPARHKVAVSVEPVPSEDQAPAA